VKTAKRIAKDMEKWAKTLNQKSKQTQPSNQPQPQPLQQQPSQHSVSIKTNVPSSTSEDVAFSMLQSSSAASSTTEDNKLTGFHEGSDSANEDDATLDENQLTDWSKLACLLCKRQFPTREKLTK